MAEKECKGDMKHNLAEMYAKNMVDYGVDVTKAWQTATQQSYALEKAYIRGRQYEADRLIKLRKEYNDGWIPCGERLPKLVFSGDMTQKILKEEYNKAVDDFVKVVKKHNWTIRNRNENEFIYGAIDRLAEQLKVGGDS